MASREMEYPYRVVEPDIRLLSVKQIAKASLLLGPRSRDFLLDIGTSLLNVALPISMHYQQLGCSGHMS
jgi:hypothetical protein